MSKNKLIIAAAGAGKTTHIVKEALQKKEDVLITTYTEANEAEIRNKIIKLNRFVPPNITIQTWFSFLLQHGIKPYQGVLTRENIKGVQFVQTQSAMYCSEQNSFLKYYFNTAGQIYSDKLSKFAIRCNEKSSGKVFDRISRIYRHIYVDEVQDLAGYDLEVLIKLFASTSNIVLVGDPRQVTYLTHHEKRYSSYRNGLIENFIADHCKQYDVEIDKTSLVFSHRNNSFICSFSSKLYPDFPASVPCKCPTCRDEISDHNGIYLVHSRYVDLYRDTFEPIVLRYSGAKPPEWNFGKSKGLGFKRVLIYPPKTCSAFLHSGVLTKIERGEVKPAFDISKFYVAVTRAMHSVGIVYDHKAEEKFIEGLNKFQPF